MVDTFLVRLLTFSNKPAITQVCQVIGWGCRSANTRRHLRNSSRRLGLIPGYGWFLVESIPLLLFYTDALYFDDAIYVQCCLARSKLRTALVKLLGYRQYCLYLEGPELL